MRFQAGTDDNSLKNVLAAEAADVDVREFVDRNAEAFLPHAAARITSQCTPRQGRLPRPSPVFRRLG